MNLYDRDYSVLTEEERLSLNAVNKCDDQFIKAEIYAKLPRACKYFKTLFPNNYLGQDDLLEREILRDKNASFLALISDQQTKERDILNFITNTKSYHIIGSLLTHYYVGHHFTFLFPEFNIGNEFKADYLIVASGSGGYEFVFVELESVYGDITLKNGNLGNCFRKGIVQVKDWMRKIEGNFSIIRNELDKFRNKKINFPDEFIEYDKSRIHCVVISGRRDDFNERTYREKRESGIAIMHYDNLYDTSQELLKKSSY